MKNPSLNKQCPCGSHKKYKRCCLLTRPKPLSQEEKFLRELNDSILDEDDHFDKMFDEQVGHLFCENPFCPQSSEPVSISMSFGFEESDEIIYWK
ncbi:MAG: hypothetical protein HON90_15700 [Halobacteriovoraceae bacterium]|jgi:hypothetical protein|nr:hypothetical protein [Halobacteriovoraceae bacterium]